VKLLVHRRCCSSGLGWIRVGAIPGFAVDPDGTTPHDSVILYKQLTTLAE
jgi:hypothetical protein